jgi:riboflavin kinase / FMN adenylyltransferase
MRNMRVVYFVGKEPPIAPLGRAVIAVGAFDGVHLGHRRLLEHVAAVAAREDARAVAVVLWPDAHQAAETADEPRLLTTLGERLALLAGLALVDAAVVLPLNEQRDAEAADSALDALAAICDPVVVIAGTDSAFRGIERRGPRVQTLGEGETEHASEASILDALRAGRLDDANRRLGHPYPLGGEVVAGDRRGRTIGFPTANLRLDPRKALPANGVYAVRVGLPGEAEAAHAGVCNIGVRPTFGGEPRLLVEIHLLDAAMDLYGLTLHVDLIARLRDERRFNGIDELKAQIARDAEAARGRLE